MESPSNNFERSRLLSLAIFLAVNSRLPNYTQFVQNMTSTCIFKSRDLLHDSSNSDSNRDIRVCECERSSTRVEIKGRHEVGISRISELSRWIVAQLSKGFFQVILGRHLCWRCLLCLCNVSGVVIDAVDLCLSLKRCCGYHSRTVLQFS